MDIAISAKGNRMTRNAQIAAAVLLGTTGASATTYLVEVMPEEHTAILREHERSANAGATSTFDKVNNRTRWFVAQKLVAVSEGPLGSRKRYWSAINLTPQQHAFAADQVSNNDVSGDEELVDHFFFEGRISRAESLALLIERNRCLVQPFFEPLQERFAMTPVDSAH